MRIITLMDIIAARFGSLHERIKLGLASTNRHELERIRVFMENLQVWALVTRDEDKHILQDLHARLEELHPIWKDRIQVYATSDIDAALQTMT